MPELKGLATGIGSLPYKDPDRALDLIFKYLPDIPFWPQLPKKDVREGMVAQFTRNLPCLEINPQGVVFNPQAKEAKLEAFYERVISLDADYFNLGQDFAAGFYAFCKHLERTGAGEARFIKCHLTGPFTFAASIKDEKGLVLLHDPVFMQVIIKGLAMKGLWQIKTLKKFNKRIIMFMDEPYLGCFGSAYTPLNREDAVRVLIEFTEGLKSENVLLGVHCCGNTDWSIFTDVPAIDIINFDAFSFLDRLILYTDNLKGFLRRGGILCWGIAPTQEYSESQTPDLLLRKIRAGIEGMARKGLDRDLLSERLLISPSCGLGTLDSEKAEGILKLLAETSSLIKNTP